LAVSLLGPALRDGLGVVKGVVEPLILSASGKRCAMEEFGENGGVGVMVPGRWAMSTAELGSAHPLRTMPSSVA
jgi:hypothetical protein